MELSFTILSFGCFLQATNKVQVLVILRTSTAENNCLCCDWRSYIIVSYLRLSRGVHLQEESWKRICTQCLDEVIATSYSAVGKLILGLATGRREEKEQETQESGCPKLCPYLCLYLC